MQLANLARAGQFLSTPSARRATGGQSAPIMQGLFLSTPSARRATFSGSRTMCFALFLSTPSARRATRSSSAPGLVSLNFYPRPPRGGRRA